MNSINRAKEILGVNGPMSQREKNAVTGNSQAGRVLHALMGGEWYTLYELHALILKDQFKMDSEAGISARIRDLRSMYGLTIMSRPRSPSQAHEYKLIIQAEAKEHDQDLAA